jgi:outer membrane protein
MKRLVVIFITAICAAFFSFGTCAAQNLSVGFVDFQTLLHNSKKAQAQQKRLQALVARKSAALEAKKKELLTLQDELRKQGEMLKEDTRTTRIKEIGIKKMEYELAEQQAKKALQREQRDVEQAFHRDITKIIAKLRLQKKLTMIFNGAALLSVDDKLNLTNEVVRMYDATASAPAAPAAAPPKARTAPVRRAPK